MPVVDEWGYPKHSGGVKEQAGLCVLGLPWLTRHYSPIVGGVGWMRTILPPKLPVANGREDALRDGLRVFIASGRHLSARMRGPVPG